MKLLDSATLRVPGWLVERGAGWARRELTVRCGLIEHAGRKVLVDAGYGPRVTEGDRSRALRLYTGLLRPQLTPFAIGPGDVDMVLLTHLHADHVSRLRDFPAARFLVSRAALDAFARMSPREALHHAIFTELLPPDLVARAEAIEALPRRPTGTALGDGYDLFGDGTYLVVPLPGHALGHVGLLWTSPEGRTLYATDVAWTLRALLEDRTPVLSRRLVFEDAAQGRETEAQVRAFAAAGGIVRLCHDPRS